MKRRYQSSGTRKYLYWSLGLLAVGMLFAWDGWLLPWLRGMWDGWLPRQAVLEAHPDPSDHFYLFNQVTGGLLLAASAVCAYIHSVVR